MSGSFFKPKVAAIILAAGNSTRMTQIKQNLPWKGETLLTHVIRQLKQSEASSVYVVLGAHKDEILSSNDLSNSSVIHNENWELGMGISLARAIDHILQSDVEYDGFLIALSDQPIIETTHYNKLINSCIDHKRIIASYYNNDLGVPAVFGKHYGKELAELSKDIGAKSIIKGHMEHVIKLEAPMAKYDLDTKADYEKFYQTHGRI